MGDRFTSAKFLVPIILYTVASTLDLMRMRGKQRFYGDVYQTPHGTEMHPLYVSVRVHALAEGCLPVNVESEIRHLKSEQ